MAGTIVEWLAFFLFIFLFIGSIVAEVQWLVRKGWATSSRAVGFVLTTDLVGFCIGGAVVFIAFFVMFVMVMGPAGRLSRKISAPFSHTMMPSSRWTRRVSAAKGMGAGFRNFRRNGGKF